MTRDVEMELSLWEMLLAVKRHWLLMLICMVICAALGGVLGYIRASSQVTDAVPGAEVGQTINDLSKVSKEHVEYAEELFKNNREQADEFDAFNKEIADDLRVEWDRLKDVRANDPLMKIDPSNSEMERITFRFEDGSHASMVYDWIQEADEKSLFGDASNDVVKHKGDIILLNGATMSGNSNGSFGVGGDSYSGECTVSLLAVDGFDTKKAGTFLKSWISSKANAAGIQVLGTSSSHVIGENSYVRNYQQGITDKMTDIQARLANLYSAAIAVVAPPSFTDVAETDATVAAPVSAGVDLKGLLKYVLVGFVLGIVAGAALAIFLTLRKGCAISRRQVEESFGLELLSDMGSGAAGAGGAGGVALDILNANLDVMVGDGASVMVLGSFPDAEGADVSGCVSAWNDGGSSREFVAGRDIIDDSVTIDALSGVEGILLGVRIGESKLTDIQRVLIRAKKLGKRVLGYVIM